MKVVFSHRAYASIMAETTEKIKTETGGLFLGAVEGDTWFVVEAIDPGPKSVFEIAYFEYDKNYTQHLINKIANLYEEKLSLIGLWHRHPGSFDVFSSTDNGTNAKYAQMRKCGAISALVNIDPKFRLTMYHVAQPCKYTKISYSVGDEFIPDKFLKLKTSERFIKMMDNMLGNSYKEDLHVSVSLESFMNLIIPCLNDYEFEVKPNKPQNSINEVLDKIVDTVISDVMFMSDEIGIEMSVVRQDVMVALVQSTITGIDKVFFAFSEEDNTIFFSYDGKYYKYRDSLFLETYKKLKEQNNDKENITPDVSVNDGHGLLDGVLRLIGFDK